MNMCFDGLGQFHLEFVDPRYNTPYAFMFGKQDTVNLYQYLREHRFEFIEDHAALSLCGNGQAVAPIPEGIL